LIIVLNYQYFRDQFGHVPALLNGGNMHKPFAFLKHAQLFVRIILVLDALAGCVPHQALRERRLMHALAMTQAAEIGFGQADRQMRRLAIVTAAEHLAALVEPSEGLAVA
jgi:hypothetical protein